MECSKECSMKCSVNCPAAPWHMPDVQRHASYAWRACLSTHFTRVSLHMPARMSLPMPSVSVIANSSHRRLNSTVGELNAIGTFHRMPLGTFHRTSLGNVPSSTPLEGPSARFAHGTFHRTLHRPWGQARRRVPRTSSSGRGSRSGWRRSTTTCSAPARV